MKMDRKQIRTHYNAHAGQYIGHKRPAAEFAKIDEFLRRCGPRVLDIGCWHGDIARHAAAQGKKVVGIDSSYEMIRLARQMPAPGCEFFARELEQFSTVVMFDAALLLFTLINYGKEEVFRNLEIVRRFLKCTEKEKGMLMIGMQKGNGRAIAKNATSDSELMVVLWKETELQRALIKAGFTAIEMSARDPVQGELPFPKLYAIATVRPIATLR